MQVSLFPCPHCGARLRLRDKSFAGRTISCPDCRKPVAVTIAADGRLTGAAVQPAPQQAAPATAAPAPTAGEHQLSPFPQSARAPLWKRLLSPAGIGWLTAVAVAAAGFIYLFYEPPTSESLADPGAPGVDSPVDDPQPPDHPQRPPPDDITPESRLAALGVRTSGFTAAHAHFPTSSSPVELPVTDRLSWLAALAIEQDRLNRVQPQQNRAWHDPLNDRFVRRRVPEFQNPLIDEIVGAAGYPATHFAGMAGVGPDAARLPKHHPRAGIFGDDRVTTVEDIREGQADTLMILGVESHLASWAAHGRGAVRPLTAEPYVHGPDGFGTGQPEGMHVLMADGSVRFITGDIDPVLMRRMAAMADGLPLDPNVPGEPGATVVDPQLADAMPTDDADAADADPAVAEPIDVPLAADEPWINVDAALALPVLQFSQPDPVPAEVLLRQLEELGGVPIDRSPVLNSPDAARLDQPVTVSLADTTFEHILQTVLTKLQLSFTAGPQGITLHPADQP